MIIKKNYLANQITSSFYTSNVWYCDSGCFLNYFLLENILK
jgi:hypothetical protein